MAVSCNARACTQMFAHLERCTILGLGLLNRDVHYQTYPISRSISRQISGSPFSSCLSPAADIQLSRRAGGHSYSTIVESPYPKLSIPENISLDQYMLNEFPKYGEKIALVRVRLLFIIIIL